MWDMNPINRDVDDVIVDNIVIKPLGINGPKGSHAHGLLEEGVINHNGSFTIIP